MPGGIPPTAPPGAPGGGGGSGVPERPDASGLLEGNADVWTPNGSSVPRPPEAETFTPAGGAGLQTGTPASGAAGMGGMPMMPGSPGAGTPGGGSAAVPERPDAAGLVEGDTADWTSDLGAVDGPAAPTGAAAGSSVGLEAALASPAEVLASPADVPASPTAVQMMPGLPGVKGPGSSDDRAGQEPGRPEAAGLLAEEGAVWTPGAPAASSSRPASAASAREEPEGRAASGNLAAEEPITAVGSTMAEPEPAVPVPPSVAFGVVAAVNEPEQAKVVGSPAIGPGARTPERPAAERPDASALLTEEAERWGPTDPAVSPDNNVVPLLRLDDVEAEPAAWDETDASWLLADDAYRHDSPGEGGRSHG